MTQQKHQALVTGGTRGIGRAICLELALRGYEIAFTYRSNAQLADSLCQELAQTGTRAQAFEMDLGNESSIETAMADIHTQFPKLNLLVNNAAISIDGLMLRFASKDLDALLSTNLKGSFLVTQSALRPMLKNRDGNVIFISSVIGEMGNAGQVAYSATKAALLGMTKSLAQEVAARKVRVNAITPGFIQTDMTSTLPEATKQSILSQIPLATLGEPQDIAKAVAFLASSDSKYITGQILAVNGGLYM
jgi:3-oxoacyl-[acyl-carrier protein] reductase